MKVHLVTSTNSEGYSFPLAWSKDKRLAMEYADLCFRDCSVKTITDVQLLSYLEKYYLIELK